MGYVMYLNGAVFYPDEPCSSGSSVTSSWAAIGRSILPLFLICTKGLSCIIKNEKCKVPCKVRYLTRGKNLMWGLFCSTISLLTIVFNFLDQMSGKHKL